MPEAAPAPRARKAMRDVADALRFFSRLPLPAAPGFDLNRVAWATPLAGAVIGLFGAAALGLARALSLPPLVAAALAFAALALTSGALHEDGLADVADGFGGGATRERKLAIMRDSRIGAYGVVALALSLILRVGALAALLEAGFWPAAAALVLAAAASRAAALLPLALLSPARADGAGAAAGRLEADAAAMSFVVAGGVAAVLGLSSLGLARALLAVVGAGLAAAGMAGLARRQIGGQTGDVAGAAQQLAEIAVWCALLIGRGAP